MFYHPWEAILWAFGREIHGNYGDPMCFSTVLPSIHQHKNHPFFGDSIWGFMGISGCFMGNYGDYNLMIWHLLWLDMVSSSF